MNSIFRIVGKVGLCAAFLFMFVATASAQATRDETVTVQVDITLPTGTQVTGTALIQRHPGTMRDDISFVGTIGGSYASAKATGSEAWTGPHEATFTIDKITQWESKKKEPQVPLVFHVSQGSANLLTVNGVPVAISGELKAPGSGSASYTITAAGNGPQVVALLPNTGEGPTITTPLLMVMALVASGLALLGLGLCLGSLRLQRIKIKREDD